MNKLNHLLLLDHENRDDEGIASDKDSYSDQGYDQYLTKDSNTLNDYDPGAGSRTRRSSMSELSRIVSGIRDDINQDYENTDEYRERQFPEKIITDQLDLISRKSTRADDVERGLRDYESNERRSYSGRSSRESVGSADDVETGNDHEKDQDDKSIPPPDKGFAWVIALISMFSVFSTWGANAGFGVFLDYYMTNSTFPGASRYDYALIGGIVVFLAQFLSPFCTLMTRILGIKVVTLIGIVLQTAGYILASFSTKLWQIYLTQGVIVGISFSFVYLPATLVLPTWFDKHRALAFGICVSGAGLGGLTFALSVNKVISISGDQKWGLRLTALVALATALPCFFLKPRYQTSLPFSKRASKKFIFDNIMLIFDSRIFKSFPIMLLGLWFGVCLLGYVVMLFSIAPYATLVGLTASQGSTLTALLNAGQVVGRPLFGLVADKMGRTTCASAVCLIISILLWAFWINAKSYGALIPFSFIIGAIVGVGSTMCQPICSDLIDDQSLLPAGWSTLNIIVSFFCLAAEVLALALKKDDAPSPFLHAQIFTGCCFFVCLLIMLAIREQVVRKTFNTRLASSRARIDELHKPKSRYLKVTDLDKAEEEKQEIALLQERITRHHYLLRRATTAYFIRMFYPIRV